MTYLDKVPPMYQALADAVIGGTTDEESVFASANIGSLVVPADRCQIGTKFSIYLNVLYTLPALNPADLTLRMKFGGTTIRTLTIPASIFDGLALDSLGGTVNASMTFRTVGSAALCVPGGGVLFDGGTVGAAKYRSLTASPPSVVDTTIDSAIDCTAQWGSSLAQAANTLTVTVAEITPVN